MARYATQMYLGISDEEISADNKRKSIKNSVEYMFNSEYWIVFEYFLQTSHFIEIGKGVFILCSYCLATLNPFRTIAEFFLHAKRFMKSYRSTYRYNFSDFVNNFFKQSSRQKQIDDDTLKIKNHCQKFLDMLNIHKDQNHFLEFSHGITSYSMSNIVKYDGGYSLFKIDDDFNNFQYWKDKIANIGSGVVLFKNAVQMYGLTEHLDKMKEYFLFYMSVSMVVKGVVHNDIIECPFLYNFPICKASFKDSSNCFKNPYAMANEEDEDGKCLFGNGVSLLALDNRIIRMS